ncbi:MAG: putative maltokinase [Myxococcota bacterium]
MASTLLEGFAKKRRYMGSAAGEVRCVADDGFAAVWSDGQGDLVPKHTHGEQSNTSITLGERLVFKFFRRVEMGCNPDIEIGRELTRRQFSHVAPVLGALEWQRKGTKDIASLGVLNAYVANQGDAWHLTLNSVGRYYEWALTHLSENELEHQLDGEDLLLSKSDDVPELYTESFGTYLPLVMVLGERVAQLHVSLSSAHSSQAFTPEPFSELYQRSMYQSARTRVARAIKLLGAQLSGLPEEVQADAQDLIGRKEQLLERLKQIAGKKLDALRVRCHGDLHLGQILYTGKDFAIIDFEGEPVRSIGERRFKRSPLLDVAGMLRSFHYAQVAALRHDPLALRDTERLAPWGRHWCRRVSAEFVRSYLEVARKADFLPSTDAGIAALLDFYLLDKAAYELLYELNNRPSWVHIPLTGLLDLLATDPKVETDV